MKKLITILTLLLISQVLFAQAPQATSYQAVIRNSSGNVLSNQLVKVRFSIHDSAANGTVVYQETQTPTTNAQGLINLFAGKGTATLGTFAGINWGNKSKFLQAEIDIAGGNNFTDMGTMQLMSVPYALYSNNGNPNGTAVGEMLYWNGTTWVKVTPGTYGQSLMICDGVPTWGGCSPKITTSVASAVSYTIATSGGNVTAEGGVSVTSRGVCWSTTLNPTISLSTKTVNGTGAGSFTSSITGLTANTTYYVRAYATNSVGTAYGTQLTFRTLSYTTPILTTTTPTNINRTSAISGGSITSDGGATITARGICWSTTTNPTIELTTKTINGIGTGAFTSSITGLTANTTYYLRAYATNNVGTSYGAQLTFTTSLDSCINCGFLSGSYSCVGYFYHPTVPRSLNLVKSLVFYDSTTLRVGIGDLESSGQFFLLKKNQDNTLSLSSYPGSYTITQYDTFTFPSNTYTPQWSRSSECNNTFDPYGGEFKIRYGYNSGSLFRIVEEILHIQ